MDLVKPLSFLFFVLFSLSTARAADPATSAARSGQAPISLVPADSGVKDLAAPEGKVGAQVILRTEKRILVKPFAGVCFTMRTYKAKPTERFQDGESGAMQYSTCQMGSDYELRTAGDAPAKLK
jgi:hypothetical protein